VRKVSIAILFFVNIFIVSCAGKLSSLSASGDNFVNYALEQNGATIVAAGKDNEIHTPETLINGITDPSLWGKGEGWEYTFENWRLQSSPSFYTRSYFVGTESSLYDAGWVEIRLAEPKIINRVVIYALHNNNYIFPGYESAALYVKEAKTNEWKGVAIIKK